MTLQQLFAVVCAHDFRSPVSDNARDLQLLRDVNSQLQQVGSVRIVYFFVYVFIAYILPSRFCRQSIYLEMQPHRGLGFQ